MIGKLEFFKMLLNVDDWKIIYHFNRLDLEDIEHSSGLRFWSSTNGITIRDKDGKIVSEGFWRFYLFIIPVLILKFRLKRDLNET